MSLEALTEREQTLDVLQRTQRFLLVTHENPDGDALGSLVAMRGALDALGKDALMYLSPHEFPLPDEYRFLRLEGMVNELPADAATRTMIFLDCGNLDRNPLGTVVEDGSPILNIDHHHDNTRFGTVNHVVEEASCTAEIVWDLMSALGVAPEGEVAEALYVGLVTDTGRFMYENTGRRAHEMAAELIEAGVDVHAIYRRLYEELPEAKLALLARALGRMERHDGGRITLSFLTAEDFMQTHSKDSYSEGVIDHLRAVSGTVVAALVRARLDPGRAGERKVSLRATGDEVDVSAIARAQQGGGHRRAAGFTTTLDDDALVAFLRKHVDAQLGG